jgi:hypothetical protein
MYTFYNQDGAVYVLFLAGKKRIKRSQPKGRYQIGPPLETPAASPFGVQKCSDF